MTGRSGRGNGTGAPIGAAGADEEARPSGSFDSGIALNPEQREAVEHGEGPLLVLAGAGSGKTRVLTVRVARLIRRLGIPPDRILAVTFTNRAAGEMRERIAGLLGREPRGLWIGTFHAIAARLLRREAGWAGRDRAFTIYDEDDALRVLKEAMEAAGADPRRWSPQAIRARISDAKNALIGPTDYAPAAFDLPARVTADVYPVYQRLLLRRNAYDFDDLLVQAVRLLEEDEVARDRYAGRFLHVLVDEYQDTNHAQYRMVRALGRRHGNVCVVGDDDQAVYGWRGADIRNILDFERDFPGAKVVRLERNYRSTGSILEVANEVIACNANRKPKTLRTAREAGAPVRVVHTADERQEATWTAREIRALPGPYGPGACVVLYRTNAQSRAYEEAFRSAGLPYRIVGGVPFYERREIKDVLAYLRLAVNPADDVAFERAVRWPRRGVGGVTLERLREAADADEAPLLEASVAATRIEALPTAGARSLEGFAAEMAAFREETLRGSARQAIEACVRRFGLAAALEEEEDGADRLENVTELVAAAASFDAGEMEDGPPGASELERFLQSVALRAEIDDAELEGETVTLMTLHNAKGLEFPIVFVAGLEEGLFPLSRAVDGKGGVEEERRLFYVGVTRARDRLYLSHADRRWRAGSERRSAPSSFLDELPEGPVERRIVGTDGGGRRRASGRASRWGGRADAPGAAPSRADEEPGDWSWRHAPGRRAAEAEAAGPRYDYTDSQVPLEVEPGARIVHPRFGPGRILSVSGRGRELKAEIEFEAIGVKKVFVAHAGLRPA